MAVRLPVEVEGTHPVDLGSAVESLGHLDEESVVRIFQRGLRTAVAAYDNEPVQKVLSEELSISAPILNGGQSKFKQIQGNLAKGEDAKELAAAANFGMDVIFYSFRFSEDPELRRALYLTKPTQLDNQVETIWGIVNNAGSTSEKMEVAQKTLEAEHPFLGRLLRVIDESFTENVNVEDLPTQEDIDIASAIRSGSYTAAFAIATYINEQKIRSTQKPVIDETEDKTPDPETLFSPDYLALQRILSSSNFTGLGLSVKGGYSLTNGTGPVQDAVRIEQAKEQPALDALYKELVEPEVDTSIDLDEGWRQEFKEAIKVSVDLGFKRGLKTVLNVFGKSTSPELKQAFGDGNINIELLLEVLPAAYNRATQRALALGNPPDDEPALVEAYPILKQVSEDFRQQGDDHVKSMSPFARDKQLMTFLHGGYTVLEAIALYLKMTQQIQPTAD